MNDYFAKKENSHQEKMLSQGANGGGGREGDRTPPQLECGFQATSPASCFRGYSEWRGFVIDLSRA